MSAVFPPEIVKMLVQGRREVMAVRCTCKSLADFCGDCELEWQLHWGDDGTVSFVTLLAGDELLIECSGDWLDLVPDYLAFVVAREFILVGGADDMVAMYSFGRNIRLRDDTAAIITTSDLPKVLEVRRPGNTVIIIQAEPGAAAEEQARLALDKHGRISETYEEIECIIVIKYNAADLYNYTRGRFCVAQKLDNFNDTVTVEHLERQRKCARFI